MKNYIITAVLVIAAGFVGYVLGKRSVRYKSNPQIAYETTTTSELRLKGEYKFINPLLEFDNSQESTLLIAKTLEKRITQFIDSVKTANTVSHISYYYRDLNNGQWIGIGEHENFSPASLLKVPIMIAALKKAETNPTFLRKKINYDKPFDSGLVPNVTDSTIKPGNSYTIDTLIYKMIIFSDNEARLLLLQNIEVPLLTKVYTDIGIDVSRFDDSQDFMSVKTYSNFFRLLYNATYLNKEYSEKALEMLSHSHFYKGLPANLPKGTVIAHKFGERGYVDAPIRQLHDCGIVYKGITPYLIGVMTRGVNIDTQAKIIADISKLTYDYHH